MNDWVHLKQRAAQHSSIARVLIDPTEQELVRNPKFATELAELAQKVGFVVELAGGILSHAYYMLSSSGCRVECADLYATDEGAIDFNKLVRDKIPEAIHAKGEEVKYVKLEGEALIKALKRKIIEEAFEVSDAETRHDIVEELADLRETVNALTKNLGITNKEIEDARIEKNLVVVPSIMLSC
ncbi:nucleoside triphosphate pyrophosphohydrolase [Pseudomonas poae]|uniref:nucleoside triphosphate pyrophosphohydrolase n=1 Tax=Pseudomonas poae TaxID=200451 RepID=UPI003D9BB430